MTQLLLSYTTLSFLLVSTAPIERSNSETPIETTVCAVSSEPSKFEGRLLEIRAQFESDGIERSVLTDKDCINFGIAPLSPKRYVGESALTKALSKGHPGTLDKTIIGTFIGKFSWHPDQIPNRTLSLQEVRNVSVVMK
ncbi:hypothetical protein [Edaphobacter bradus]|uniref:hypothetical protein n=1 Tax=Edaphobacter bradus TaxID=2259016 RepID=UPI0021DF93D2|nr:hypothetical protein [Edaphobacter bradus]